jgi:hypothetical protein
MYGTEETYGTDHSTIFSMRVATHYTVNIIMYKYKCIIYPVSSKYNIDFFREGRGVEYDITGTVKVIVTVRHSAVYYK